MTVLHPTGKLGGVLRSAVIPLDDELVLRIEACTKRVKKVAAAAGDCRSLDRA